jgi:effector-binding domain-containing protein
MKYLKLFESFSSIEELVQEAKEICLELNDDNIRTDCYYNNSYVADGKSQPGFITIGIERTEFEDDDMGYGLAGYLEWHEVEEVVDRLIDYFESNGWHLSSIMMDGDNLINPKEWIETLRKKVSYTFSGLTINFTQR